MPVSVAQAFTSQEDLDKSGYKFRGKQISPVDIRRRKNLFRQNGSIRAAFETLIRHLLGGGVIVDKPDYELLECDKLLFNSVWIKFGKIALCDLIQYAIVVCGVTTHNEPCVLPLEQLNLSVDFAPDGRHVYFVQPGINSNIRFKPSADGDEYVSNVTVFETDDPSVADPDDLTDGLPKLNSAIGTIIQLEAFTNKMIQCATSAEIRRCAPPLFTESMKRSPQQEQFDRDYNLYGDHVEDRSADREREQEDSIRMTAEHEQLLRTMNSSLRYEHGDYEPEDVDPMNGETRGRVHKSDSGFVNKWIPLPNDRTLATGPSAASPAFIIDLLQFMQGEASKVVGVPVGLWGTSGGGQAMAVNQTLMNTFYATQQEKRVQLEFIFKVYIHIIYGASNMKHMLETYNSNRSVFEHITRHTVDVSFPGMSDPLVLDKLYEMEAISEETYAMYTASYSGIPLKHFDLKRMSAAHALRVKTAQMALVQPDSEGGGGKPPKPPANPKPKATFAGLAKKTDPNAARTGGGKSTNSGSQQAHVKNPPAGNRR